MQAILIRTGKIDPVTLSPCHLVAAAVLSRSTSDVGS